MRSALGAAGDPPHLPQLVPGARPAAQGEGPGETQPTRASGTESARPRHRLPPCCSGCGGGQGVPATPAPAASAPRPARPCLPESPPPGLPRADLFLRAVGSLLDVLGEDARLDVGHGCGCRGGCEGGQAARRPGDEEGGGAGGAGEAAKSRRAPGGGEEGARRRGRLKRQSRQDALALAVTRGGWRAKRVKKPRECPQ